MAMIGVTRTGSGGYFVFGTRSGDFCLQGHLTLSELHELHTAITAELAEGEPLSGPPTHLTELQARALNEVHQYGAIDAYELRFRIMHTGDTHGLLARLEQRGLVAARYTGTGPGHARYYTTTPAGAEALAHHYERQP